MECEAELDRLMEDIEEECGKKVATRLLNGISKCVDRNDNEEDIGDCNRDVGRELEDVCEPL